MTQDPATRDRAATLLHSLFNHIGSGGTQPVPAGVNLGAMGTQIQQLLEIPVELAQIFIGMAGDLTEVILTSLEQAGIVLAEGLIP